MSHRPSWYWDKKIVVINPPVFNLFFGPPKRIKLTNALTRWPRQLPNKTRGCSCRDSRISRIENDSSAFDLSPSWIRNSSNYSHCSPPPSSTQLTLACVTYVRSAFQKHTSPSKANSWHQIQIFHDIVILIKVVVLYKNWRRRRRSQIPSQS